MSQKNDLSPTTFLSFFFFFFFFFFQLFFEIQMKLLNIVLNGAAGEESFGPSPRRSHLCNITVLPSSLNFRACPWLEWVVCFCRMRISSVCVCVGGGGGGLTEDYYLAHRILLIGYNSL